MKKTYEYGSNQGFLIGLNVRGKQIAVKFDDGYSKPQNLNNRFTTDDVDIQKALEATKHFKIGSLKLIKSVGEELSEGVSDVSADLEIPKPLKETEAKKEIPKKVKPIEEKVLRYKSFQQAANYLMKNFGIEASELVTPEQVMKAATDNNITLPNLSV